MAVLPVHAYRRRDEALMEGTVKLIYKPVHSIAGKEISILPAELNAVIKQALETLSIPFLKGRDYSRRHQFDGPGKAALSQVTYELQLQAVVKVMKHGHVSPMPDKHYYGVPCRLICQKIKLVLSAPVWEDSSMIPLQRHFPFRQSETAPLQWQKRLRALMTFTFSSIR